MEREPSRDHATDGALAYQAALGDILEILGRAPFDLDAVLRTIVTHAARLCNAERGFVRLREADGRYHHVAEIGAPQALVDFNRANPITPTRATLTGRTVIERKPVHIPDVDLDQEYDYPEARRLGGFRAMLGVPMLREGVVVGVVDLWRDEPTPFTEAEISLVELFADQAVIALTTTRLIQTIERQRTELARFLSPQVSAMISSDDGERMLAGHRREITVVFCDLRGFTAFSEAAEPEEVIDVLRAYHQALGHRIDEAGGTLERFTGDGVMVFFNDPIEQPDHALRAARMALALRVDVAGLSAAWGRLGHRLGFGIGIGTGYATLGRIGFEGRFDYAAIGSVVNLSARLCAEAGDGVILLSPRAHAKLADLVTVRDAGVKAIKGFSKPTHVVELVGVTG